MYFDLEIPPLVGIDLEILWVFWIEKPLYILIKNQKPLVIVQPKTLAGLKLRKLRSIHQERQCADRQCTHNQCKDYQYTYNPHAHNQYTEHCTADDHD